MFFVILLGLLLTNPLQAIENSQPVRDSKFDSVVMLEIYFNNNDYGQCGGVIISKRNILTARHCFEGSKGVQEIKVSLGSSLQFKNGQYYYKVLKKIKARVMDRSKSWEQVIVGNIPAGDDYQVIQTSEDMEVVPSPVSSEREFKQVFSNPRSYQFLAVAVNLVEHFSTLESRRGVELSGMKLNGFMERHKYIGPENYSDLLVQPGDSGSPLFVYIGGDWKVVGVTKGMRESYPKGTAYCPVYLEKL